MDKNKMKITLDIPNCNLPKLEIEREDEYYYRQAAKEVQRVLAIYQMRYRDFNEEVHYYMALVHFATHMYRLKGMNETKPFADEMAESIKQMEALLKG